MYGLKQAGRGWHQELTKVFTCDLGFTCLSVDHSVFHKTHGDKHMVVAVATNDILITSKCHADIAKFKTEVSKHWDLTDLGKIHWYLGFEVKHDRSARTISINQQA